MAGIEKRWYSSPGWLYLLAPFSLLFYLLTALRRGLFRLGLKASHKPDVPVIVVGNISVGGNGKTPMVLALIKVLQRAGYKPGVISRGYGGKAPVYPFVVQSDSQAGESGDEPLLIKRRAQVPVVVGPDRVAAATQLLQQGVDIIISDDGMQHYKLGRDIEIAVVDGNRRQGNGWLMPVGPLREGAWRLDTVDFVVVNGGEAQGAEIPMHLAPGDWIPLTGEPRPFPAQASMAFAGIGDPNRFFTTLTDLGIAPDACIGFSDHHHYQAQDFENWPKDKLWLMTEKDAVKCYPFAADNAWYLPIDAELPDSFEHALLQRIQER